MKKNNYEYSEEIIKICASYEDAIFELSEAVNSLEAINSKLRGSLSEQLILNKKLKAEYEQLLLKIKSTLVYKLFYLYRSMKNIILKKI